VSINSFLSTISKQGGFSLSNNFIVKFEDIPVGLTSKSSFDELIEYMCDEAQLPNINTATGTQTGVYLGLGSVDYPHTRVFTDLQLGFMLDANLDVLKFLNEWHNTIFSETAESSGGSKTENRINKLKFRDDYAGTIKITKAEIGPTSTTQRQPITYVIEKAYPYAIDAVPLQFGSAQITKVTAQFKYQRHYTINKDITNTTGSVGSMNNGYAKGKRDVVTGTLSKESEEPINWQPKVVAGGGTQLPIGIEQVNQGIA